MSEHWSLLALVVAVAAGLFAAAYSGVLIRSRQTAFFRYFMIQTLLFNLLILGGLVFRFLEMDMRSRGQPLQSFVEPAFLGVLAVLKVGWLGSFVAMTVGLPEQTLSQAWRRRLLWGAVGFITVWGALLLMATRAHAGGMAQGVVGALELVIIGGAAASCVGLIARARPLKAGRRRRSMHVLGAIYLAIFGVMVGSLVTGWLRGSGQDPRHLLFNSAFMVLYNLFPLAWVVRMEPAGVTTSDAIMRKHGVTAREQEIIELICAGHTNQEIADRLFISLATVKDHNSNIFRKTGVRNRVQLVNLMRKRHEQPPNRQNQG